LLVDDEPDVIMTLKAALQEAGFAVFAYEHPLVALSEFKPHYYDLVILDNKMEEMNGLELYAKMLKVDEHVRVCFITAREMYYDEFRNERQEGQEEELEEVKQQYCKLDPDRFLQKPISNVDLVKSIEKIMRLNKGLNIQNK
jgi:two-component system, OmpR family, response regulator ChvI